MSITAPSGTSSPSNAVLPPRRSSQNDKNRREQVLVHHLVDNLVETLTDRSGTAHDFPWNPEQNVRIGVLGVRFPPPLPSTSTPGGGGSSPAPTNYSDDDGQPDAGPGGVAGGGPVVAAPIDNRGVLGLDFVVSGDVSIVELDIDVAYAIYHPLVPPFSLVNLEATNRARAAGSNPRRRPTVPINPSWVRDNRRVRVHASVAVGTDEETYASRFVPGDPLSADATNAVATHFATPQALWKLTNNQTLPVAAAMGTPAEFQQALNGRRDASWQPVVPEPVITITTMKTVAGDVAVSVSLRNELQVQNREIQDLSLYDAQMTVTVAPPASLEPQRLRLAEDDSRYDGAATVVGRGRGCVARPGDSADSLVAETLPFHVQWHAKATDHGADISFSNLAGNFMPTLEHIGAAMRTFLRTWDTMTATPTEPTQVELKRQFNSEVERFELGLDLLRADTRLARAFALTNEAFARSRGRSPNDGWRLFQLVFILTELGALAGRENANDPRLRHELDSVDVLWFPTGGGKTEAYLGLITVGLFYDRLRGKERGVTAWLLFPLRMLSVQQLARVAEIIHHAEAIRAVEHIPGDPFALGYFVGSGNTPNRLGYRDPHGWWPGIDAFSRLTTDERRQRRLVGACPACKLGDSVVLDVDLAYQRLLHVCSSCGHVLAIHASDDEVVRYQPSVIVSTVDKITAFARNGQLTSFNRGPRRRCPQHGWYTHKTCVAKDCATDPATHTSPAGFLDPVPALWIQDELHLVREELGVFAGHYHTLMAELAVGAGHEPSKVIAATATIEQFEDQLSQVYGRKPRMFPTGGPNLSKSFYTETTDDVRRVYLGALPAGGGTVKVDLAGEITTELVRHIHQLMNEPSPAIAAWATEGLIVTPAEAKAILFDYELVLAYVNSKAHGVNILDDICRLSEELLNANEDRVTARSLTGETTLGELAATVAEVQGNTPGTPRADRLRALVGTSVVSHGVDLDRLNFEVLAGMPPSYAQYIQATARAGRTHVGLVVSVFDRANRRETSMFQSFATTHAALERMVEPVPVNRFATRAIERTLPGLICALLWDETRNPAWPSTEEISTTRRFRAWWDANAANLLPVLKRRVERAYRCPVPDPATTADEQRLVDDAVHRWEQVERLRMQQWQAEWLTELFTSPAMTSLRDVDPPVEFSAGRFAGQIVDRMYG